MTNSKDVILKLKEVREEKGLSYADILDLMENNGDFVSKSTLSRVFAEGSEDIKFRYEDTIRPIAKALLDIENLEETDDLDTKALKALLKYKIARIEREQSRRSIEFLKEQVSLKDKRMDLLLDAVFEKDLQHKEMLTKLLKCSKCPDEN